MSTIRTTIVDGYVHVPAPGDLPDGTEVEVHISPFDRSFKIGDGDWNDSPESIEEWLRWYDGIGPLDLTETERAAISKAHNEGKDWEKAQFLERSEELRKLWE